MQETDVVLVPTGDETSKVVADALGGSSTWILGFPWSMEDLRSASR